VGLRWQSCRLGSGGCCHGGDGEVFCCSRCVGGEEVGLGVVISAALTLVMCPCCSEEVVQIGVRAVCVGHIFKFRLNGTTVERHYLSPKLFIAAVLAFTPPLLCC
jgi:hypothetical protein